MDSTSFRLLFAKYGRVLGNTMLALLIFAAGWHTGRSMSPYYTAHPIVFEDRKCEDCSSSGGSTEELVSLQEEGREDKQRATATTSPTAEVAGVTTNSTEAVEKAFVASSKSTLYHHRECSSARRIKAENQVWFTSPEEAKNAGYSPSKCTLQKLKY